jgi:hypothetical protein
MIIYNVTSHVAHSIHTEWLQWMQEVHIPMVLQTGCFTHYQWVKVLDTDESEGFTYAVQYYASSMQQIEQYQQQFAPQLQQAVKAAWGDEIVSFRSLMQIVH